MIPHTGSFLVDIYRQSSYVVDPATAAASMTVNRQPARRALFRIKVSGGTTGSGTVTIAGTLGGVANSQAVVFTANDEKRTTILLDAVTSVSTTGLANEATVATVSVEALDETGRPQAQEILVVSERSAQRGRGSGDWQTRKGGTIEDDEPPLVLDYEEVWTPRVGDVVKQQAATDKWRVEHVRVWPGPTRPQYYRLRVSRLAS